MYGAKPPHPHQLSWLSVCIRRGNSIFSLLKLGTRWFKLVETLRYNTVGRGFVDLLLLAAQWPWVRLIL
jgi:hypothetical protein